MLLLQVNLSFDHVQIQGKQTPSSLYDHRLTQDGTERFLFDFQWFGIYFHEKIILDEEVTANGEQIDDDHGKHRCQDDGFRIAHNTLNDIP
jgi:hypothetical protein